MAWTYFMGAMAGATAAGFLVSRLFLWFSERWNGGMIRLALVHLLSLAIILAIHASGGFSSARGDVILAVVMLTCAQALCLVWDGCRESLSAHQ